MAAPIVDASLIAARSSTTLMRRRRDQGWVWNGFTSQVHRKKPVGHADPSRQWSGGIEHVFAEQKDRMGLS